MKPPTMLHCLLLPAARVGAFAGANEDIGVEKGGRGVASKPCLLVGASLAQP